MMVFGLLALALADTIQGTAFVSGSGDQRKVDVKKGINRTGTCWATYDPLETDGWHKYSVETNPAADAADQTYCAGYLQGYLAHENLYNSALLLMDSVAENISRDTGYPEELTTWMQKNLNYTLEQTSKDHESEEDRSYWGKVKLVLDIFNGLADGYMKREEDKPKDKKFDKVMLWMLQCEVDNADVLATLGKAKWNDWRKARCTAAIRLLPDFSDVYMMHNTWTDYRQLHGSLVTYNMNVDEFSAKKTVLSTRLGMVGSLDDFYVSDNGLMTFETTVMNANETWAKEFVRPQTLPTWLRALMAQLYAKDGKEWINLFFRENSGTYNNDYYITDLNKFKPYVAPTSDLVWLVEQTPSDVLYTRDMTAELVSEGFLASFNVPVWQEVYDHMEYGKWADKDPMYVAFKNHSRYLISKRDLPKVVDFDGFKAFSLYNDYKNDPLSKFKTWQDPVATIAARGDLLTPEMVVDREDEVMMGALDSKCVKGSEVWTKLNVHAINGPMHNVEKGIPVFSFSGLPAPFTNVAHDGLPDKWDQFDWIQLAGQNTTTCEGYSSQYSCLGAKFCGWCGATKQCMAGNNDGPFFDGKCENGWITTDKWNLPIMIGCVVGVVAFSVILGIVLIVLKRKEPTKLNSYEKIARTPLT